MFFVRIFSSIRPKVLSLILDSSFAFSARWVKSLRICLGKALLCHTLKKLRLFYNILAEPIFKQFSILFIPILTILVSFPSSLRRVYLYAVNLLSKKLPSFSIPIWNLVSLIEQVELSSSCWIFFLIDSSSFRRSAWVFYYELHNYLKYLFSSSSTLLSLSQSNIMAFMVMSDSLRRVSSD